MVHRAIFAIVLILPTFPAHALNYIDACARALTYTEVSTSSDLAAQLAYLKTKIEAHKNDNKTGLEIDIPVLGKGTYNEARNEAKNLEETLGIHWSLDQSQSYLAKYVSADANTTFGNCVRQVLQRRVLRPE
jgi:hypothetical protein